MKLEDFIKENKNEFDLKEPSENHFEKFQDSLENSKSKRFNFRSLLKIASIALLVVMSSLWLIENFILQDSTQQSLIQLSDLSDNYKEVEVFYTSGINNAFSDLDKFGEEGRLLKDDLLKQEFAELDSTYIKLQNELSLKPGDERIIEAMVIHYKTKLSIINNILSQLEKTKPHKSRKDETTEV